MGAVEKGFVEADVVGPVLDAGQAPVDGAQRLHGAPVASTVWFSVELYMHPRHVPGSQEHCVWVSEPEQLDELPHTEI